MWRLPVNEPLWTSGVARLLCAPLLLLQLGTLTACGAMSSLPEDAAAWVGDAPGQGAGVGDQPVDPGHDDPCGKGLKGPWMVPMILPMGGSFCADSTEVTRWQYAAFLTARYPLSEQPLHCAWNDSYVPWSWHEQTRDDLPAVSMDWCDARAYCAWAGKRLCGRVGGGTVGLQQSLDPLRDEWGYACSGGGKHAFPYGDTYVPTACVTNGYDGIPGDQEATDFLRPVKSAPACIGGFSGLYDLSGNAFEWEDAADQNAGPQDVMMLRGGDFQTGVADSACLSPSGDKRSSFSPSIGFRCCKDGPSSHPP